MNDLGTPLTSEELHRFERDGFVGPFVYADEDRMASIRAEIERQVLEREAPDPRRRFECRHLDCRVVYDICASDPLVDRVSSILGPDVILWNSVFFCKWPGGREVPWHQDHDFLFLDPCVNVAVWLAVDRATRANGCLQVIPGSHTRRVPHLPRTAQNQFIARADLAHVDRSRAIDLPLAPGEFVIMHSNLLHHSAANLSPERRMGLVARYTVPGVKVNDDGLKGGPFVYCVRGEDRLQVNPTAPCPMPS